jgi:hypothetical protein
MRLALRILAILTIVAMGGGLGLFFGFGSQNNLTLGAGALVIGAGGLLALASFIVGVIAAVQRRQTGWMIGLIAAGLLSVCGAPVAAGVAQLLAPHTSLSAGCQNLEASPGTDTPPACQPGPGQMLLFSSSAVLFLLGPVVVAVLALVYSYRMREVSVSPQGPGVA